MHVISVRGSQEIGLRGQSDVLQSHELPVIFTYGLDKHRMIPLQLFLWQCRVMVLQEGLFVWLPLQKMAWKEECSLGKIFPRFMKARNDIFLFSLSAMC